MSPLIVLSVCRETFWQCRTSFRARVNPKKPLIFSNHRWRRPSSVRGRRDNRGGSLHLIVPFGSPHHIAHFHASVRTMLDRNNVGCGNQLPVNVPSTQPNGLQSRKPGHKRNENRKLVHTTHIISFKYGSDSVRPFLRKPCTTFRAFSITDTRRSD